MSYRNYDILGNWDASPFGEMIYLRRHYYLLGAAVPGRSYIRGVRLDKSHPVYHDEDFSVSVEPLEAFREDCKTQYALTPIFRYEMENIDTSRFAGIPMEEMGMELFTEFCEAYEVLDYKVKKMS